MAYYSLKSAKDNGGGAVVQANMGALYHYIGDTKRARAAFGSAAGKLGSADVAPKAREAAAAYGG